MPPSATGVILTAYPTNVFFLTQPGRSSSTRFGMTLIAAPGFNYTVLDTTNLPASTSNWSTLLIISNLVGSPYVLQDNLATNSRKFYRALIGP